MAWSDAARAAALEARRRAGQKKFGGTRTLEGNWVKTKYWDPQGSDRGERLRAALKKLRELRQTRWDKSKREYDRRQAKFESGGDDLGSMYRGGKIHRGG